MKKHFWSILLIFVLVVCALPMAAMAEEETVTVYFDNSVAKWEMVVALYKGADGTVRSLREIAPGENGLYPVQVPANAMIRYQNYLPGQPAEAAPPEGFQGMEFEQVVAEKVYTYPQNFPDDPGETTEPAQTPENGGGAGEKEDNDWIIWFFLALVVAGTVAGTLIATRKRHK